MADFAVRKKSCIQAKRPQAPAKNTIVQFAHCHTILFKLSDGLLTIMNLFYDQPLLSTSVGILSSEVHDKLLYYIRDTWSIMALIK